MAVLEAIQKITVDEFLAQPENGERMELVDGEIIMSPMPKTDHQLLLFHLAYLLRVRVGNSGLVIGEKEMIVRDLLDGTRVRVPDLCYIRESRHEIISDEAIRGPADIVIEILSEATEEIDRITKRDEYRATGVPEYWIVDLSARAVLIHYFAQDRQGLFQGDDEFESEVLKAAELPCQFSVPELFGILR